MNPDVNSSPERHVITQIAVAGNDFFRHGLGICVEEDRLLVKVANNLSEVVRSVAELSKLPVDDAELWWLVPRWV